MDGKFWQEKIESIKNQSIEMAPSILISIFIFIIFYIMAGYYKKIILDSSKGLVGSEQEKRTENIIHHELSVIIYYVIFGLGIIFALVNLGFNVATILTVLGTAGLSLGLAFQETFKNMISGTYISMNNLFRIGDIVSLRMLTSVHSTITGTIVDFNLYYTTIVETQTNLQTIIPNAMIQNNMLTNITKSHY